MKYILFTVVLVSVVLLLIACNNKSQVNTLPSNPYLIDVRTPAEFESGSVPNAINIPLSEVESSIDKFKGKENIVVFCRSGNRSGKAKTILEANGIPNVTNGGSWNNVLEIIEREK